MGIPDPGLLNYHRLADTLQAVFRHWQVIAAKVTLNAVQQLGLKVEMVHYDTIRSSRHCVNAAISW